MKNTFSYEVKHEILIKRYDSFCCAISSLCAIFQTIGEVVIFRGGFTVSLVIDHDDMFEFVVETVEKYYGKLSSETQIITTNHMGETRREIIFDGKLGERLLFDTGIVSIENGNVSINKNIEKTLVLEDCCKVAYLSHLFAGAGSIAMPSVETKSGYHLEFALSNETTAYDVMQILSDFDILPKMTKRGGKWIVYIKDRNSIQDLVGIFGANKSVIKMANMTTERDMHNQINRDANCLTANYSKTVDASAKQLAAIALIEDVIGLEMLSNALFDIAKLRKENPQASIAELAKLIGISKSAARERLNSLLLLSKSLE